jgi:hypothetical protein
VGRRAALFAHAGTETPSAKQQLDYLMTEPEWQRYLAVENSGDYRADAGSFTKIVERPRHADMRARERADMAENYASYIHDFPAAPSGAPPAPTEATAAGAPASPPTAASLDWQKVIPPRTPDLVLDQSMPRYPDARIDGQVAVNINVAKDGRPVSESFRALSFGEPRVQGSGGTMPRNNRVEWSHTV